MTVPARRARLARLPAPALTFLAVVLLAGCSAHSGVAVGPSDKPGLPRAYVTRCAGEKISSVRLVQLGPDENNPGKGEVILWQIAADPPQPLDEVVVGDQLPGFRVVVEPRLPLPLGADLDLTVDSTVTGDAFFRLRDLRPGRVDWEGRQVSFQAFRHGAYYGGKCTSDPLPLWFTVSAWGLVVAMAAATGVAVFVLLANGRRREKA